MVFSVSSVAVPPVSKPPADRSIAARPASLLIRPGPHTRVPDLRDHADPLAQTLHLLRMSGVVYCQSELTAPWGVALPAMADCLMFHVVTDGQGWLLTDDGAPPRRLRAGDFVLLPHGRGHRLVSDPQVPAVPLFDIARQPLADWFELMQYGGGGAGTTLICGAVRFDDPVARHLTAALPTVVPIDGLRGTEMDWLAASLRLLGAEARQRRPGCETVITRLADILVVQAIRSWLDGDAQRSDGWLRGVTDRHVGRALAEIHRDLGQRWTVAMLAQHAGLSRSAFAARFTRLVGVPAMDYVTQWRMRLALARLQQSRLPLGQLAADCGYESEAAFNRAFKRAHGMTPGAVLSAA